MPTFPVKLRNSSWEGRATSVFGAGDGQVDLAKTLNKSLGLRVSLLYQQSSPHCHQHPQPGYALPRPRNAHLNQLGLAEPQFAVRNPAEIRELKPSSQFSISGQITLKYLL